VQKRQTKGARRLRIFTTKEELKLAGHPYWHVFLLAELGVVPAQEAACTFFKKQARDLAGGDPFQDGARSASP